ncbi:MAG: hypothetical protein QXT28_09060 [Thermofilaceae archaeon]
MGRMKRLWWEMRRELYYSHPLSIPLIVASCKRHGWDVYDPLERKGFVQPTLERVYEHLMRRFSCPMCGYPHILYVLLIEEHRAEVLTLYEFALRAVRDRAMREARGDAR